MLHVRADGLIHLTEKSKEELIDTILEQQKAIAEKEKQIQDLKKKLGEYEKAEARRAELKANRHHAKAKRPQKPGQKVGHIGITRPRPTHIDRTVEQTLTNCPDCDHRLGSSQDVIEHFQEDIIPAHVEVTLFKRHRYYCSHCSKMVTAPYAPDEIPHGRIGPNALIHMAILKYHHALPGNKIVELFKELAGFTISEGAVAQTLQRLSRWLKVETDHILEAIRKSPVIHMDETGWKINGKGHWLWIFVNERLAYYKIDKSRGSKVPRKILPKDYGGITVTDFYAAYSKLPGKKQRCLVHLFREMHHSLEKDQSKTFLKYHKELKRILSDALRLKERSPCLKRTVFYRRFARIKQRLYLWSLRDYRNHHLEKLAKRFLRHWQELTTFLEYPGVPFSNNLAERMILPNVILRNRSYQNRSPKGALAHEINMSLLQTLRLQGKNTVHAFKYAYLAHRKGNTLPCLGL